MSEEAVARARELLGVPFRHQGRHAVFGLDCIGLVTEAYRSAGHAVWDVAAYSRTPKPELLFAGLENNGLERVEVTPEEIRAGDILMFAMFKGVPQHLAIAAGNGMMIHTDQHVGRVVEMRLGPAWLRRLHSVWRRKDG